MNVSERKLFDPRIESALDRLDETESGREISQYLRQGDVDIEVLPKAEYEAKYPGGGIFRAFEQKIVLPDIALDRPSLVTLIAHEGKHALDAPSMFSTIKQTGAGLLGALGDSVKAAAQLKNPITAGVDGAHDRFIDYEVDAYRTQAKIAGELGINESSRSYGQAKDGSVLSEEETRARIIERELYQFSDKQRLLAGAGFTVAATLAATAAVGILPIGLPIKAAASGSIAAGLGAAYLQDARRTVAD